MNPADSILIIRSEVQFIIKNLTSGFSLGFQAVYALV